MLKVTQLLINCVKNLPVKLHVLDNFVSIVNGSRYIYEHYSNGYYGITIYYGAIINFIIQETSTGINVKCHIGLSTMDHFLKEEVLKRTYDFPYYHSPVYYTISENIFNSIFDTCYPNAVERLKLVMS